MTCARIGADEDMRPSALTLAAMMRTCSSSRDVSSWPARSALPRLLTRYGVATWLSCAGLPRPRLTFRCDIQIAPQELEMSMAKDPAIVDSFFSEMSNGCVFPKGRGHLFLFAASS